MLVKPKTTKQFVVLVSAFLVRGKFLLTSEI